VPRSAACTGIAAHACAARERRSRWNAQASSGTWLQMRARAIRREHASSAAVSHQRQALELPALESARELTLREAESDDEEGDGTAAVALRSVRARARACVGYPARMCACTVRAQTYAAVRTGARPPRALLDRAPRVLDRKGAHGRRRGAARVRCAAQELGVDLVQPQLTSCCRDRKWESCFAMIDAQV
jgi:hypothetical protein